MEKGFEIKPEITDNRLEDIKKDLIEKAKQKYGDIVYVSNKKDWNDCFTVYNGRLRFWFNTKDDNTHTVEADLPF